MILPYYKIEKTEEGKEFFYSHYGYFNFWDEYLIANIPEGDGKVFYLLVNRTGFKNSCAETTKKFRSAMRNNIEDSICSLEPEEMFDDFPEMKNRYVRIV